MSRDPKAPIDSLDDAADWFGDDLDVFDMPPSTEPTVNDEALATLVETFDLDETEPFVDVSVGFNPAPPIEDAEFFSDPVLDAQRLAEAAQADYVWDQAGVDAKLLKARIEDAFSPTGALARALPGYAVRDAQGAFAQHVLDVMTNHGTFVAEAGTGTGKTFAYLVPALLGGIKTIVSTAGKTLQDQIFEKDIPLLAKALGVHADVTVLKGRANYLCPYRLAVEYDTQAQLESQTAIDFDSSNARNQRHDAKDEGPRPMEILESLKAFATQTQTGDRAEFTGIETNHPIWLKVTSTRENCLGRQCPSWDNCFVKKARERALEADVIVVNHHLYLSSVDTRRRAGGNIDGLLPRVGLTIFDEAHKLRDIATNFFGEIFSTQSVQILLQNIWMRIGTVRADAMGEWRTVMSDVGQAVDTFREALRVADLEDDGRPVDISKLPNLYLARRAADNYVTQLTVAKQKLALVMGDDLELTQSGEALDLMASVMESWQKDVFQACDTPETRGVGLEPPPNAVRWIEITDRGIRLNTTPLSVAPFFRQMREDDSGGWVFTSATLSTSSTANVEGFQYFEKSLGLTDPVRALWPSPFDYWAQSLIYLPKEAKKPDFRDPTSHFRFVAREVAWPLIEAAQGGVFVLCTSHLGVSVIHETLAECMAQSVKTYPLYQQNDLPAKTLIQAFRADKNAVLVASMGFWEGVDVQGEALRVVVIDRLPFGNPSDPVFKARCDALEREKKSSFMQLTVPEAKIHLKQGAGRLIRSERDRGVIAICDPRIMKYGLMDALPDSYKTRELEQALDELIDPTRNDRWRWA